MVERFVTLLVAVLFIITPYAPVYPPPEEVNGPQTIERPVDGPSPLDLDDLLVFIEC